jgi:acetate---CoA ligase (ADP-forming)
MVFCFPKGGNMNFQAFFKPSTLAVVGVSSVNDSHPANVIFNKNLLRYPVKVFPVNPRGGTLQGERVYRTIGEIPEKVDLAVIAVRAEHCLGIVEDCIRAGVRAATVVSGGFAESGRKDLQDALAAAAQEAGFPFIGPNCLGVYSPGRVDTLFLPGERIVHPHPGHVALVSQSGGILVDQMIKFTEGEVGLSLAVSIGNKAVVREIDLLNYFAADPETKVIVFYVEGFGKDEGREFVLAASCCPKPVLVLKAGKSPGGVKAISSHTASLSGDYEVFSSVLSQYDVIEVKAESDLVSFCESLLCYPRTITGNVGIVTGSGGHGALAVDHCFRHSLSVPALSDPVRQAIRDKLSENIRAIAALNNPLDLTGSAVDDDFVAAVDHLGRADEVDCIMILMLPYLPGVTSYVGARLSQTYRRTGKPLVAYIPLVEKYRMLIEGFELNGIPVSSSIEGAVNMVEAIRRVRPC